MNGSSVLVSLAWHFSLMSLFAVGGANAAIPEMHRLFVDVQHLITDRQFADMFAISQLSPGPNFIIVTLIGYQAAGLTGAILATLAMCAPSGVLAYTVGGIWEKHREARWRVIVQSALVPVSIGLVSASIFLLVQTIDHNWQAALLTVATAGVAFGTRFHPLWMLLAGGLIGFAGFI